MSKNKMIRKKGRDIGQVWELLAPSYGLPLPFNTSTQILQVSRVLSIRILKDSIHLVFENSEKFPA